MTGDTALAAKMRLMNIGIVGLGDMGGAMMGRLAGGDGIYGYNRTRAKAEAFASKGVHVAETPRALTEACDVVLSIVTNDEALAAIARGDDGIIAGLRAGKVWIEFSTVSPDSIRELDSEVQKTRAVLLDGAVLGSPKTVADGQALLMVSGDAATCERVRAGLRPISEKMHRVGDVGHSKVMKIALNLNMPVQILALSEGVLLAEKSGIDRKVALDIMLGGVIASPMLAYRAPFIVDPPQRAWFDMGMMQKDVRLAMELAREVEVPLPTTSVANDMLTAARARGMEREDFAALFHVLAAMAGIERGNA